MTHTNSAIIKRAILNACGTALYVIAIATFLFYVPKMFDSTKPDTVFAPILMLSLLVFSVAVVGSLIFGAPIFWYIDGKKKEAVSLLIYTLTTFFVIIVGIALVFI